MELKNDKILGTHASCTNVVPNTFFRKYAKYQDYNVVYQLVNKVSCLHLDVGRRSDGITRINDCSTIDEFKETIEKYFIHNSEGYVLLYITGDESSVEATNDALMDNIRTCYAYGVENVETLKGKICILKNTKLFKVKNQKEYDSLNLDNEHINVVTHVVPMKYWIITMNYASFGIACACWGFCVVTAYLFWWISFYSFVVLGTLCAYAYSYVGHDNKQIFRTKQPFIQRYQSIFLTNFYEA
jgi:hypothetical protein